jgi:hypothetical protein
MKRRACLIAAVRLAREEKWDNSPRVVARIADAIQLADRIYKRDDGVTPTAAAFDDDGDRTLPVTVQNMGFLLDRLNFR